MQTKLPKFKWRTYVLAIAICSTCFASDSEKIVTTTGADFSNIQRMLDDGWTVKAQSSVVLNSYGQGWHNQKDVLHVFTLTPPSPERQAENEMRKKEEFERKREEYLRQKRASNHRN